MTRLGRNTLLSGQIADDIDVVVAAGGDDNSGAAGTGASGNSNPAGVAEIRSGHVHYEAPDAADLVSVVDVLDPIANGALIIVKQPDVPRKLQVRIVDGNNSVTGDVTLVGVGPSGEVVGEVIQLTGGTRTVITEEAYASLTSATVANVAGAAAGDTISIGVGNALGLPGSKTPASSTFAVYRASVDDDVEAVGTVDGVAGTIIPTSAPNAARRYDFWYTYEVAGNIGAHTHTGPSHTHTQPTHVHTATVS